MESGDTMADNISFAYWLRRRYARWRYGPFNVQSIIHPERRISQFSQWLGIDLRLLVGWMSGERPDPESEDFRRIAEKLGPNVYDRLGLPRPNEHSRRFWIDMNPITSWRVRRSD
jgi:hypothetical protein